MKVHFVKKARKTKGGVKKGESYYWWNFAFGPKMTSKTFPTRSQLTRSEFLGQMYDLEDRYSNMTEASDSDSLVSLADELRDLASEVSGVGDECRDKVSNMEQAFPNGSPTIDLMNERADSCEEISRELEEAAGQVESELSEHEGKELSEDDIQSVLGLVQVDWSYE